jgi:heptosyltransferase-2
VGLSLTVGIIRTSSIGDVVLATACLEALFAAAPDARVIWVGRQPTLSLLKAAWPSISTLQLSSGAPRQQFKQVNDALAVCDLIVDLQNSFLTRRLAARLRGLGKTVVSAKKLKLFRLALVIKAFVRGRLLQLPSSIRLVQKYQYQMMIDALREGLKAFGIKSLEETVSGRPRLPVPSAITDDNLLWRDMRFGRWLAVAPGASHQPKRAPTDVFRDILTHLSELLAGERTGLGLVFIGSSEDRSAVNQLTDSLAWDGPLLNLAGKLTLEQSASVIAGTKALLSTDSGLAHISEAVGVPAAVLFGPTVEAFGFPPWRLESRAYSAQIGCRPCSRHGKKACRYRDNLCFHGIDVRHVAKDLAKIIGGLP